jgi:3',5'-cyclic AMP phosphodiesterase CpdA
MFRILHISDLHIVDKSVGQQKSSSLQTLVKIVGKDKFDVEVNAKAWDPNKLDSLKNRAVTIQPDMIVVTGDLTNYGDEESFDKAFAVIKDLQQECHAQYVICVPGNHDTLVDRSRHLKSKAMQRMVIRGVGALIGEVDAIRRVAERKLEASLVFPSLNLSTKKKNGPVRPDLPFLTTYLDKLPSELAYPDPAKPIEVDLAWATGLFFLINSNSVSALMANEGNAGIETVNAIDRYASKNPSKFAASLKFAILHHHPISAPQEGVQAGERAYDWMKDGPRLLAFLHSRGFRFILHGHEHIPFDCTVKYGTNDEGLHIVAAGSALQGGKGGSFNVLELSSAYVAQRHRWDYTTNGFEERVPPLTLEIRSLWPLRSVEVATTAQTSLRNLIRVPFDPGSKYKTFSAAVEITPEYTYRARYSYAGNVLNERGSRGPVLTFTGDPAMKFERMQFRARDNRTSEALDPEIIEDTPYQKVVRVLYRSRRAVDAEFDITVEFIWETTQQETHCWDLFNLSYYVGPLELFDYDITLATNAAQFELKCRSFQDYVPEYEERKATQLPDKRWQWGFTIKKPQPVVTIIEFHPADCRHKSERPC